MALANYSTLNNFQREYERINGSNPEDCVGATWSVILGTIFPAMQGDYAIESQARNPGGYTDFTICDWVGPLRRPFLLWRPRRLPGAVAGQAGKVLKGSSADISKVGPKLLARARQRGQHVTAPLQSGSGCGSIHTTMRQMISRPCNVGSDAMR
ncbi:hypothetical protein ASPVEDRAFT_32994 [Aspergillus versicolor CBS 583.65]|uniref:Uncharacterized protein n=1 Tax=Aspergillus versicolor CBS 583.65 TaxID=1036611 RepID=A0A1L9PYX8_ASPVE|nr:uncharacterized protein ASPVEDRAFT_32994 [Aspergillus versicolor CBS 583.65]OJJ06718.1 hypothetical protein ASPVEDRAFT_32994 [Aspergillus versicolor CBS 583.65]